MTARTLTALVLLAAAALPGAAQAQSKADAFAGKIPPVSGQLFRKAGRLELAVTGNLSLNDAFFRKYFGGAKLAWHFTESASAAVYASGGWATRSGSAVVCTATAGCSDASEAQLRQVPGRISRIVGLELGWSPVYGKLNVLSEAVGHFDLSLLAGPAVVTHEEVLSRADADAGVVPATKNAVGGHVGIGARLFLAEWVAARFEVKDYLYVVKVPNNGTGGDLQNQLFTEVGLSFFLPPRNRAIR